MKSWWQTENFGCRYDCDTQHSVEDANVMKFLNKKTRKVDGRYEVPLIWKDQNVRLPDNRLVAVHRLNVLERRLQRDPELAAAYEKTMSSDLEKGYIKKLRKKQLHL